MPLLLALLCCCGLAAAEHGQILAVLGPDRLAVQYFQMPVVVRLADIEVPAEAAEQAQARLADVSGKKGTISWSPEFGVDAVGTPRVSITVGSESRTLSEALLESGLARFAPLAQGGWQRDRLAAAEAKARKARLGIWAAPAPAPPAAPTPAPAQAPERGPAAAPSGRFVAEVDGQHYFPVDAPEAARLNPKRTVLYASEAAAQKAGKKAWRPAAPGAIASLAEARAAYRRSKESCMQAAGQAPTEERDRIYERAFLELSGAMQVFSREAEAKPDDEALGEELRECMQLRYAAMKSKRYH